MSSPDLWGGSAEGGETVGGFEQTFRWSGRRRRVLALATAVVMISAEVGVGLPAAAAAVARPKEARELPALVSDPAPKVRPEVAEGSFADVPGRDRRNVPAGLARAPGPIRVSTGTGRW